MSSNHGKHFSNKSMEEATDTTLLEWKKYTLHIILGLATRCLVLFLHIYQLNNLVNPKWCEELKSHSLFNGSQLQIRWRETIYRGLE